MKKIIIVSLIFALSCATGKKDDAQKPDDSSTQNKNTTNNSNVEEFIHPKEGFLNGSTFQVVVYSLQSDNSTARSDALDVAKKKSVNLLISNAKQPLTGHGRTEIKSIVEESGKIIKESAQIEGKYYFIYQIQKPGLQIYITEKLN